MLPETLINAYSPQQIALRVEQAGVAKARLPPLQTVTLGILAGAFIAFGAMYYTLVMTGLFREHVERLAVGDYYETEGRRAYRFLAELGRAEAEPDAPLFARLAAGFERYAGALTYIRKVYFRDTPLPWRGLATP